MGLIPYLASCGMISRQTIDPPTKAETLCATFQPIILHPLDFTDQGVYRGDPRTARAILRHDRLGVTLGCWPSLNKH